MAHKTEEELHDLLRRCPMQGSVWVHVKSGRTYRVLHGCIMESTLEPVVVYQSTTGPVAWVRPLSEWVEKFTAT